MRLLAVYTLQPFRQKEAIFDVLSRPWTAGQKKKKHPDVEQTINPLQPQKALFKEHTESTWSDFQHNTALRDGLAGWI